MHTDDIQRLQHGTHHDPFAILGKHPHRNGIAYRAFMPEAERVILEDVGR